MLLVLCQGKLEYLIFNFFCISHVPLKEAWGNVFSLSWIGTNTIRHVRGGQNQNSFRASRECDCFASL